MTRLKKCQMIPDWLLRVAQETAIRPLVLTKRGNYGEIKRACSAKLSRSGPQATVTRSEYFAPCKVTVTRV